MKTNRKWLSVVLIVCMMMGLVLSVGPAHADELSVDGHMHDAICISCGSVTPEEYEVIECDATMENYGWCPNWDAYLTETCQGLTSMTHTTTHKPLFGETCTIYWFAGATKVHCQVCGYVYGIFVGHACKATHMHCSKGIEDVCPMSLW